jgi:hypothetical protein
VLEGNDPFRLVPEGFFSIFRPNGSGLSQVFKVINKGDEILKRVLEIYEATSEDYDGGDHICYDTSGVFTGQKGQLIEFWHADNDRNVIAPNLKSFIEAINEFYKTKEIKDFDEYFEIENIKDFPKNFYVE